MCDAIFNVNVAYSAFEFMTLYIIIIYYNLL